MVIDSRALLDYALFQLTPTRTRCDLVIFAGKKNEKVASGLLEPFLSHLKSAKDEISKGGYSITLKPPSGNSPWFTKATLERFVRFVSTPEVLERFVTTEREIDQIERSIESNENGTVDVIQGSASTSIAGVGQYKSKYESNGSIDAEAEENPKIRLQRVLESRKAMLKKEQAMAYARALVAGFEMDDIQDLASFSDAFGAHRLREACINFMELCNKKNEDKIWMDEVAAMQASYFGTPGIIVAGANTDLPLTALAKSSTSESITGHGSLDNSEGTENALPTDFNPQPSEGSAQTPIWPHYLPPYMHSAQGPVFQQMPPYPGYIFPGMSGAPSHYPGNAPWPTNFHESGMYPVRDIKDSPRYKSSSKKREKPKNHTHSNGERVEESDASSSRSNSSAEQERESRLHSQERVHSKKLNRHSSKRVVIRNINYITSGRKEDSSSDLDSSSSGEDEYVDAGSLKQQVEAAVVSVKRHQKPTSSKNKKGSSKSKRDLEVENDETAGKNDGTWDIFQNLLMRDADPMSSEMDSKAIQVQEEYSIHKGIEEDTLSSMKFDKPKYGSDDPVLTERSIGNRMESTDVKFESEQHFHGVVKRSSKDEELLIPARVEGEYYLKNADFGRESPIIKSQKEEDWILSSKQDVSAGADRNIFRGDQSSDSTFHGVETKRDVILDDSFMIQSRLSDEFPQNQPKADIFVVSDIIGATENGSNAQENMQGKVESGNYNEPEDLYMMLRHDSAPEQAAVATWSPEMDYGRDVSLVQTADMEHKDNADAPPLRGGNKTNVRNSKKQGPEVDRKAPKPRAPNGYLSRSKSDVPLRSKMSAAGRSNAEKEEEKRKKTEELLLQRQKRIAERSATKGVISKTSTRSLNESKDSVSTKSESNTSRKPVMRSSTIDRLAAPRAAPKQVSTESKTSQSRKPTSKGNSAKPTPPLKKTEGTQKKQDKVDIPDKNASNATNKEKVFTSTEPSVPEETGNSKATLHTNETEDFGDVKVLHTVTSVEKRETNVISMEEATNDQISVQVSADNHLLLQEDPPKQVEMLVNTNDHLGDTPQVTVYPAIQNNLKSSDTNIHEKRKISFSPQISVMNISTPPSDREASPELNHSRKKWNNGEGSPKVPKGFRKLLLFGRRT